MKVAVVGSRSLHIDNLKEFLPDDITEIVSGGAKGIDKCAKKYAQENHIKITEFIPEYERYGKAAPLKRNLEIINYADVIVAFWDGKSKGTQYVIDKAKEFGKQITVYLIDNHIG